MVKAEIFGSHERNTSQPPARCRKMPGAKQSNSHFAISNGIAGASVSGDVR